MHGMNLETKRELICGKYNRNGLNSMLCLIRDGNLETVHCIKESTCVSAFRKDGPRSWSFTFRIESRGYRIVRTFPISLM